MTNICQSCGMPMKEEDDYGTNADSSPHYDYCKYCYEKGEFTNDTKSLEEFVDKMLVAMEADPQAPKISKDEAIAMLQNLDRWK